MSKPVVRDGDKIHKHCIDIPESRAHETIDDEVDTGVDGEHDMRHRSCYQRPIINHGRASATQVFSHSRQTNEAVDVQNDSESDIFKVFGM